MRQLNHVITLALVAAALLWTGAATAQEIPNEYTGVLTALGKTGDFKDDVLKINIPRNDLRVTVTGRFAPTPFGFGGWMALTKGTGGTEVLMGDLVLTEDEVNPVMSAILDNGLDVTALHNHFFWEQPRIFFMHVHGMGSAAELTRRVKPAIDLIDQAATRAPQSAAPAAITSDGSLDVAALAKIVGHPGEQNGPVYKITIGRPDIDLREHGASINARMGLNTWAAFAGSDADAMVAGDVAMLEQEVTPVLKSLRANGLNVVAIHNHMTSVTPRVMFLHYYGTGPAPQLARGVRAAVDLLGKTQGAFDRHEVTAGDVIAALEGAYGVHAGERRNHTKGTCAVGSFVGNAETQAYSRSALFSGQPVPVVARFSLAGGDPRASDADRSPRGMALEFRLPDGRRQHMTMINTPMFFAAMPATFLDRMRALKPDPATGKPDPDALKAFAATHPDSAGQATFLSDHNPPVSYANSAYYGIHTFKFLNREDTVTPVRWRFVPGDGEQQLSNAQLTSMPADFLESALIARAQNGPVQWDMLLTIGESTDPQNDPTLAWPEDRRELKAGTLTISSAMPQKDAVCETINYDPLVMGEGIAATDDPVLLFRSPSYGLSFVKRLKGN
jgi:catalase